MSFMKLRKDQKVQSCMKRILSKVLALALSSFLCLACLADSNTSAIEVCNTSLKSGDYQKALHICKAQLELQQNETENLDSLYIYLSLVNIHHALGESAKESDYLKKIAEHPLFNQDVEVVYRWNRKMGQKHYFAKDFEQAKKYLYLGLSIAEKNNNSTWLSKSYNDVGLIESQLGQFRQSLLFYEKSLKLKLEQGDRYPIGTTLNNIGLIYTKLENYPESTSYYEQALDSFLKYTMEEKFDRRVFENIGHVYEDLAIAYSNINDSDKGSYYQQKALESIESKKSARQQARALVNIAKIEIEDSHFDSAQIFLDRAIKLQKKHQFDLRVEIDYQLAHLNLLVDQPDKAISFANGGVIIAKEKNDPLLLSQFYQLLSKAYQKSDINTAFYYLDLYSLTREKYLAQKFDSELKSVQVQIEKQQVEHELTLQRVENSENQSKIRELTTWILSAVLLLILSIGFTVFYLFKKKKEKQLLLQNINYHQQQLLSLNDKYQNLSQTAEATKDIKEAKAERMPDPRRQLREILVNTMLNAVSIWEQHSGKNKVELAEKSKIWTISIDNGTLRTRSLDKYLSLDKIPANPRWRNVAGTCHFILSDPELDSESRKILSESLELLMQAVKELSLNVA